MPPIKLQHIISFTSEDIKHKAENLLTGNGMWLCSTTEQSGNIKAEFQLEKAVAIDFIDIGNHYCAMICIEVGMSSWPSSQNFLSLLPTVVLMSPSDCRLGQNSKTVHMFKKNNLDKDNACKKWDRIRITCFQPFKKNTQFGLTFIKLYSQGNPLNEENQLIDNSSNKGKDDLISILPQKQSPKKMSESLQSLETCRMNPEGQDTFTNSISTKKLTSPLSRAGKLVMAHKHMPNDIDGKEQKKALEIEALNFLIAINLTENDIHSLKVSHIREEFEMKRNKLLNTREKLIFKNIALDYSSKRLQKFERERKDAECSDKERQTPNKRNLGAYALKSTHKSSPQNTNLNDSNAASTSKLSRNSLALMDSVVSPGMKRKRGSKPDELNQSENLLARNSKVIKIDNSDSEEDSNGLKILPSEGYATLEEEISDNKRRSGVCLFPVRKALEMEEQFKSSVECPICEGLFSSSVIEEHASNCNGKEASPPRIRIDTMEECPLCGEVIKSCEFEDHVQACADERYS